MKNETTVAKDIETIYAMCLKFSRDRDLIHSFIHRVLTTKLRDDINFKQRVKKLKELKYLSRTFKLFKIDYTRKIANVQEISIDYDTFSEGKHTPRNVDLIEKCRLLTNSFLYKTSSTVDHSLRCRKIEQLLFDKKVKLKTKRERVEIAVEAINVRIPCSSADLCYLLDIKKSYLSQHISAFYRKKFLEV